MSLENIHKEMKKIVRCGSLKLSNLIKPRVEKNNPEEPNEIGEKETVALAILMSLSLKEQEHGEDSDGSALPSTNLIEYSSVLELLTCPACSQVVSLPVSQCRKGHLYCSNCRTNNSCRICRQTFSEAPNIALEKIINLIAVPCKYSPHGCLSSVFQPSRLQHETVCLFRPVNCQFTQLGCKEVATVKDIIWHHKLCKYGYIYGRKKQFEPITQEQEHLLTSSLPTNTKLVSQYER